MDGQDLGMEELYLRDVRKKHMITLVFVALTALAMFGSLFFSQLSTLTPNEVVGVLKAHLLGQPVKNEVFDMIVWDFNVPRAILGALVGSTLAVGGAIMQSIMRNPLATPYTTGVSAGASMGAALFVYLGFAVVSTGGYLSSIAINAVVFAMIPTAAILLVSQQKHITPTTMILAGVAMMYVFSAATTLMMLLADPDNVQEAFEWGIGSLGRASWDNIGFVALFVIPAMLFLQMISRQINIMNSGNRGATSMGVSVRFLRNISLIVVAAMTAITVGITGGIGFLGLVAPHVARIMVGSNLRYMLPCSAALGALILIAADAVSRIVVQEGMPVGVITAVIGGPIFILLLIKGAKKVWY